MEKILVTGASGHFGKTAIKNLINKSGDSKKIYAMIRDENKAEDLKKMGAEVLIANYNDYSSLILAFKDIDRILFISSSDLSDRDNQHKNVVNAAKETRVKHILYTSVLQNENIENSAIAFVNEVHIKTEKWLAESGLSYAIMRNSVYMDLIPFFIGDKVIETQSIYFPAGIGKAAFALRSDMAEAAANILLQNVFSEKIYPITNPQTYSYQDVSDAISQISGKEILYTSPSSEEYKKMLLEMGVSQEYIFFLSSFAEAQFQGEFDLASEELKNLLGRKPVSLKEYLQHLFKES
jgi:NAD(P)H dehydrogenase (quinone)